MQNFVYVRGINATTGPQTSHIYLYYVDTSLVLWPQNWKKQGIMYDNNESRNWVVVTAQNRNDIVGSNPPFIWTPPRQGIHYCLVAWASNNQAEPNLYDIGTVNDMGNFILKHPNVGWRNTIKVDKTPATIENNAAIEGPREGGYVNIGVQCQNLPTDGRIEFSVPGPDQKNTINFSANIVNPNYGPTVQVQYPPKFNTTLTFRYFKGATNPPDGANIIPIVGSPNMKSDYISFANSVAPHRLAAVHHYGTPAELKNNLLRGVPVQKMLIVGSVPFKLV